MPSNASRRDVLRAGGALSLCAVAGCLSNGRDDAAAEAGDDPSWRSFGHDAANTNYAPDGVAPTDGVAERWRLRGERLSAQAAIADGAVYAPVMTTVVAVDAESGDVLWSTDPAEDGAIHWATPTVADGTVYVGDGRNRVRAFDADSGDVAWERELDGGVYGSPTLGFGGRNLFVGTSEETLYALDPETGETRWTRDVFGAIGTTPAEEARAVYVAANSGELYALTQHGRGIWRASLPATTQCTPVLAGESLYVGCDDGRVYAVDAARGARRWSADVGGFATHVAAAGGLVVADAMRGTVALDADGGGTRWRLGTANERTNPVVVGDTVYAGGEELTATRLRGRVSLGPLRIGARRFAREFGGDVVHHVSGGEGLLVAAVSDRDGDGAVVAFESP